MKQLPIAIEKRISYLSSSKEIFDESKKYCEEDALTKCGYNHELTYKPNSNQKILNKRERNSELSKEYWEVRPKGGNPKVTWKILKKCSAYNLE